MYKDKENKTSKHDGKRIKYMVNGINVSTRDQRFKGCSIKNVSSSDCGV